MMIFFWLSNISINIYLNMKVEKKLTSVHVLEDVYRKFKINAIDGNINLQKLVNRTLDLYVKDESFRNKINNYTDLSVSGSKY